MQVFLFELCQTGASRAVGEGLKDTQQAGGTDEEDPHKSNQIYNRSTCDIIPPILIAEIVYN